MQCPGYLSIWISGLRIFVSPEVFHNLTSHLDEENRLTSGWVTHPLTGYDNIACLLFLCSVIFFPLIELISVVRSKGHEKNSAWNAAMGCCPPLPRDQRNSVSEVSSSGAGTIPSRALQRGFSNQKNQWGNWESLWEPVAHATTPLLWAYAQDNNLTCNGRVLYLPTLVQSGMNSY